MSGDASVASEVAEVVARAREAQKSWAQATFRERSRWLKKLAHRLLHDEEMLRVISAETGKPTFEAMGFEVGYVLETIRHLASSRGRKVLRERCGRPFVFPWKRTRVRFSPRGVVAVIGPWNFPLQNTFGDAVAPLLAGNAVVIKPSPFAPGASRRIAALWNETGLPNGVLQIVEGEESTGKTLVDLCDMVFFTGSVAVGRKVASQAAQRLIPCITELGGTSPLLVLGDADLEAAATAAAWGAFANAGQICIRPERILVVESVAQAFVDCLVAKANALRQGRDPEQVDIGPVMTENQIFRAQAQIAEAVAAGARVLCGLTPGTPVTDRMVPPTVVDRVPPDARLAREETFAPIIPIIRVKDAEEALRIANDSPYGLAGYIFSRDVPSARMLACRLDVGSICINDVLVNYFCVGAPLGGRKDSGLGYRNSLQALLQFCSPRTIVEDRPLLGRFAPLVRRELAFPYRARTIRWLRFLMRWLYP